MNMDVAKLLAKSGAFEVEQLDSWEPGLTTTDIMRDKDFISMGTSIGKNVLMLHMHHPNSEVARYITLVHLPTGNRLRLSFKGEEA